MGSWTCARPAAVRGIATLAVAVTAHGDRREVGIGSRGHKSKQSVAGNDRPCPNCGTQQARASRGAGRAERSWYIHALTEWGTWRVAACYRFLPRIAGKPTRAMKKGKETASQTSIGSHPARAPEGKTSRKIGVEIITTPYTAARQPPPLQAGREYGLVCSLQGMSRICSHQPGWDL